MSDNTQSVWKRLLESLSFARGATIVALVLFALLILVIWQNGFKDLITQDGAIKLLTSLSQVEFARFLITLLVIFIVVTVAGQMAYALFNPKGVGDVPLDKRISMGRELLTVFIGLLGTLMGFYFAENRVSPDNVQKIANTVQSPATNQTNLSETRAFESLLKQDYAAAVGALDDAYKATPPSSNIANITLIKKYLADNTQGFSGSGDRKEHWKSLYCLISNGKMAAGMSKEIVDQFQSGCNLQENTNANVVATPLPTQTNTVGGTNVNANSNRPLAGGNR